MNSQLFKVNVSAVVKKADTFLLIKRAETETVFPGYWGIPGGTLESTDASLEDALSREFLEEVGITIKPVKIIANNVAQRSDKTMLYIVYVAEHVAGDARPLEDTEKAEWLPFDEAKKLHLTPQTLEMLELCLS